MSLLCSVITAAEIKFPLSGMDRDKVVHINDGMFSKALCFETLVSKLLGMQPLEMMQYPVSPLVSGHGLVNMIELFPCLFEYKGTYKHTLSCFLILLIIL